LGKKKNLGAEGICLRNVQMIRQRLFGGNNQKRGKGARGPTFSGTTCLRNVQMILSSCDQRGYKYCWLVTFLGPVRLPFGGTNGRPSPGLPVAGPCWSPCEVGEEVPGPMLRPVHC
jgi:hypothetical protein